MHDICVWITYVCAHLVLGKKWKTERRLKNSQFSVLSKLTFYEKYPVSEALRIIFS